MSELRQNLATKEWVVISTERAQKPNAVLNKIIGTPVSDKEHDPECPFCHWHIQLIPRTKIIGGFERGTHIQVNTALPEVSARMLRECRTCET
jgi:galactose-1-phosphate uridylyltransferase